MNAVSSVPKLDSVALCAPALSVTAVPHVVGAPSMLGVKFADVAVPPCVFDTVFTSVNVAGWSLLVIVQVAF